jgi:hypothetical protein
MTCFGLCDGMVTLLINGVHNDYVTRWDDPDSTYAISISGLCAGDYTATVKDIYGCTASSGPLTVNEPDQVIVEAGSDIFICIGDSPYKIHTTTSGGTGSNYTYSWEPGMVAGLDDPTLEAPTLTPNGLSYGEFYVTATDGNGCSGSDYLEVFMTPASIMGTVFRDGLGTPQTSGNVYLIKVDAPDMQWMYLDTVPVNNTNGTYFFPSVPMNDVIVLYRPEESVPVSYLPTYYGDTTDWEGAFQISPNCGDAFTGKNITCEQPLNEYLDGTCTFTGTVYLVRTGKTLTEDPIPLIDVIVKKTPPGNAAVTYDITDASGVFLINNIDTGGVYTFQVMIPGIGMQENYPIEVEVDDLGYNNLDFYAVVDTITGEAGIYTANPDGISPIKRDHKDMLVFPNPFTDHIQLIFANEPSATFTVNLFDVTGKLITAVAEQTGNLYLLNTGMLDQGIYIAEVRTENEVFRTRVIKK